MMELIKFSNLVKRVIRKKITGETKNYLQELPIGKTNYKFKFELENKIVRVLSPLKSLPTVFEFANRIIPQKDYTYSIRVLKESKTSTLSKTSSVNTPIEKTKQGITSGEKIQRIFYEILKTEDFKITYSEQEGTIITFKEVDDARRFFQTIVGLFPFADVGKENKSLFVDCTISIEEYERFKKKDTKKGMVKCSITIDNTTVGTKTGAFIL